MLVVREGTVTSKGGSEGEVKRLRSNRVGKVVLPKGGREET